MRITFTPGQVAMLVGRAERQLEQIVADSIREPGHGRNIARAAQHMLHETVVTLIRLYREQVPEGAPVATRIARAYAKGADAQTGVPTLACVRTILSIMRDASELVEVQPTQPQPELQQHRPPNMGAG
ncbi:hypothetical protein [Massilia sp. BSC265]|uniref:hypothetical protein n=1 Tax=Massilia sp. BSC265 TaxID=1549812 RepID=UPI0004E92348|nr:hypothetical protein [Massilia sp. BSC265]KFI08375.1 hypothetical protein JN27_04225 [Massilia sp. BSC265]